MHEKNIERIPSKNERRRKWEKRRPMWEKGISKKDERIPKWEKRRPKWEKRILLGLMTGGFQRIAKTIRPAREIAKKGQDLTGAKIIFYLDKKFSK